jgi:hypothetical protein
MTIAASRRLLEQRNIIAHHSRDFLGNLDNTSPESKPTNAEIPAEIGENVKTDIAEKLANWFLKSIEEAQENGNNPGPPKTPPAGWRFRLCGHSRRVPAFLRSHPEDLSALTGTDPLLLMEVDPADAHVFVRH